MVHGFECVVESASVVTLKTALYAYASDICDGQEHGRDVCSVTFDGVTDTTHIKRAGRSGSTAKANWSSNTSTNVATVCRCAP